MFLSARDERHDAQPALYHHPATPFVIGVNVQLAMQATAVALGSHRLRMPALLREPVPKQSAPPSTFI